MDILGDNFVRITGIIEKKKVATYENGGTSFKCTLSIPTPPNYDKYQHINVGAWNKTAEELADVPEGTLLRITGHIENQSYSKKCRYCSGPSTAFWVEVIIDNYVVIK